MNKTKKAIFDAAIRVFSGKGYDSATVDEIAAAAGVAKGTLYYHFEGKEELFKFVISEGMDLIRTNVEEAVSKEVNPIERLKTSAKVQLRYVYQNKDLFRVILSQLWGDKNRHEEMRIEIKELINITSREIARIVGSSLDQEGIEVLGCCFVGILFSSALYEILYEGKYNEGEIVEKFMKYINQSINISQK